jgi:gamma-glutamylputrescine oxidase
MLLKQDQALNQDSYYEAGVRRPAAPPALEGRIDADVCVVGAGLTGLSAALELASRGYSVAVLEARKVGWGASGRNGGQVIVGFGHGGEDTIEAQFSAADARRAWDISMQGLELMQQRIARHAIDCDYVPGYLNLAVNARKARALQARVEHMARVYDHRQQWIPRAELGGWIASARYHGAAFDPFSGHLHPLKYTLGLAAAARTAGVRLFEDTPVIGLDSGDSPTVRTARGAVKCRFVVLAANAYLGEYDKGIAPRLTRRFLPVVTYTVATEPMAPERADALIRHRAAAGDTNHLLDYFRVSADHRLLFGGGDSQSAATAKPIHRPHAAAPAGSVSAAGRPLHRPCLGRLRRRQPEPGAGFRPARIERLLRPGLLRPRTGAERHGRQADRRGSDRAGRTLRPDGTPAAPRLSRWHLAAPAGARPCHDLLPAARPAVS